MRQILKLVGNATLKLVGYFFGFIFCLAGVATGWSSSMPNILCGVAMFIFGLWLFSGIRDKIFSRMPAAIQKKGVGGAVGCFLFTAMLISFSVSGVSEVPHATLASPPPQSNQSREEAIAKRNALMKQREESRRAELIAKRDETMDKINKLLAERKHKEVVAIASEFQPLKDPEIERALMISKTEVEAESKREQAAFALKEAETKAIAARDRVFISEKDEMTGRDIKREVFESENSVEFSFPYGGGITALLELRNHPKFGKDVIFHISKGQLQCSSYSECSVSISLDGGEPFSVRGFGPEDNSSLSIFLKWSLASKIKNAKSVKIQVPTFQNGRPVFEFNLAGIDVSRLN